MVKCALSKTGEVERAYCVAIRNFDGSETGIYSSLLCFARKPPAIIPPEAGDHAIDDAWWESLTGERRQEILDRQDQPNWAPEPCVWLDVETRQCRNHDRRPDVYREFAPGNPICLKDRALMSRSQPSAS